MMLLAVIACLFLASCSAASENDDLSNLEVVVKPNIFNDNYVIYTGQHDIVRIYVPLNQYKVEREPNYTLFFVEGDYKDDGVINKGLYVFSDGNATKLLDNGRDAIETNANTIYLGAEDGIYKYDNIGKTVTKHGSVTASISQLAYNNNTDAVYYLTDDNEVYKLNEDATASVKVTELTDVQEMAFGFEGKLYYYDSKKEFYVIDFKEEVVSKKITGLPMNMNKFVLLPSFLTNPQGVLLYADSIMYGLRNQNAVRLNLRTEVTLTALAPQPISFHFYAKDKKLYGFRFSVFHTSGAIQRKQ